MFLIIGFSLAFIVPVLLYFSYGLEKKIEISNSEIAEAEKKNVYRYMGNYHEYLMWLIQEKLAKYSIMANRQIINNQDTEDIGVDMLNAQREQILKLYSVFTGSVPSIEEIRRVDNMTQSQLDAERNAYVANKLPESINKINETYETIAGNKESNSKLEKKKYSLNILSGFISFLSLVFLTVADKIIIN